MIDYIMAALVCLFCTAALGMFCGMMDTLNTSSDIEKFEMQAEVNRAWIYWTMERAYLQDQLRLNRASEKALWSNVNYPIAKEIHDGRQLEGYVGKSRSTSGE